MGIVTVASEEGGRSITELLSGYKKLSRMGPSPFAKIGRGQLILPFGFGGWPFKSVALYGVAALALGLYATEYKKVTRYLPIYNQKYTSVDYDFIRENDQRIAEDKAAAAAKAAEKAARESS